MVWRLIFIQLLWLSISESRHYSFQQEGKTIFSSHMAHLALPLEVVNLKTAVQHVHKLADHVLRAKANDTISAAAPEIIPLAELLADEYLDLENKLSDVLHFFTDHSLDPQPLPSTREVRNAGTDNPSQTTFDMEAHDKLVKMYEEIFMPISAIYEESMKNDTEDAESNTLPPETTTVMSSVMPRRHAWSRKRSLRSSIHPDAYPDVRDIPFFKNYRPPNNLAGSGRPKRFIGGLIAGILASIGTTTLFGLFEGEKITELGNALADTNARQQAMIHLIDSNSKEIQTNRLALDTLASAVDGIAKVVEIDHWVSKMHTIVIVARHEIQKVHQALDLYVRTLQAASQDRMAFGLLSKEGAEAALATITDMAKKQNLAPILSSAQQIHQLATSFVLTESGLTLLVHCPLASDLNVYELYRFKSFPLPIGDDVFGHLYSPKSLIALGTPDQNGHQTYAEMDDVELSLCTKLNRIYICPHRQVISRPSRASCLYSLFMGNHQSSLEHCRLHLTTQDDDVVLPISKDTFISYTKKPSTYSVNCYMNNTKSSGHQLTEFTQFTVQPGCIASLPKYKVQPQSDLYYTAQPKSYQWTLPSLDWLKKDMSIKDLTEAVHKLDKIHGLPPIDPQQADILRQLQTPFHQKPTNWMSIGLAIFAVLGVATLCLCAYCRAWCKKSLTEQHPQAALFAPAPVYSVPPVSSYQHLLKAEAVDPATLPT